MAVKQSLREYRRTKLLKAAEARSIIRRCERDLNDQKAVISALLDKDGSVKTSRSSMENIVQDFYTELFRSSTFVPRCSMPPYEQPPAILDSEAANAIRSMKKGSARGLDNILADLPRSGSTALHTLLANTSTITSDRKGFHNSGKNQKPFFFSRKASGKTSPTTVPSAYYRWCISQSRKFCSIAWNAHWTNTSQ